MKLNPIRTHENEDCFEKMKFKKQQDSLRNRKESNTNCICQINIYKSSPRPIIYMSGTLEFLNTRILQNQSILTLCQVQAIIIQIAVTPA